jgi:hypothetical protein
MNSTCECGCGQVIGPADNDPFFKSYTCQKLWQISLSQPEQAQSGWRAEQRYLTELWLCVPWAEVHEYYEVEYSMIVSIANGILSDMDADMVRFTMDQVADALLVAVYRRDVLAEGRWVRAWEQVPLWAKVQQAKSPTQAAFWERREASRSATLETVSG